MKNAPVLHLIEYALYDGVRSMVSLLPHESARPIGALLGNVTWALAGSRRRTAVENLERHLVELRCAQFFAAVARQVVIAEIVGHHQDHIRAFGGARSEDR